VKPEKKEKENHDEHIGSGKRKGEFIQLRGGVEVLDYSRGEVRAIKRFQQGTERLATRRRKSVIFQGGAGPQVGGKDDLQGSPGSCR